MEASHATSYMSDTEMEMAQDTYFPPAPENSFTKPPAYYPSNIPDRFILNAVTGAKYPWKVGSLASARLFKVVDTLGTYDSDGFRIKPKSKNYPNPNPNHLYYDSPQQFMTHRKAQVQPELLARWQTTQTRLREQCQDE